MRRRTLILVIALVVGTTVAGLAARYPGAQATQVGTVHFATSCGCGSKTRAAERLGLSRQSLQQMLRRRLGGP